MIHVINIILLIIGFLLYKEDKEKPIYYYLLWLIIFPYFISLVLPMEIEDVYICNRYTNTYIYVILFHSWNLWPIKKYNKRIIFVFLLIFLSLFFLSIYHSTPVSSYIHYWRICLQFVLLYLYCFIHRLTFHGLFKFLTYCVGFEISLCLSQYYLSDSLCASFITEEGGVFDRLTGTLERSNSMVDLLGLIGIILATKLDETRYKRNRLYLILIILLMYVIFISGIRVALVAYLLILYYVILLILKSRKQKIVFVIIAIVIFSSFSTISMINSDLIQRQISGLISFGEEGFNDETSTTYATTFLITEYFVTSPLLGCGLLYKSSSGYGAVVSLENKNTTDCTLALIITEYGILFFVLVAFFFYMLFRSNDKNFGKKIMAIFLYLLMLTIVDLGITSAIHMAICVMYYYNQKRSNVKIMD